MLPNQMQWEKYGLKIYYVFGLCTFDLSHKHTHRLNRDSFVETIMETHYEIAFHIFTKNNWIIYVYV